MDPETARVEHLKLIQAVITRLARSSFAIKSTATAACAALVAFVASTDAPFVSAGGVAVLSLWLLDANFLRQERSFRRLYDSVRYGEPSARGTDRYFTMDVPVAVARRAHLLRVAVSPSLSLIYAPLVAVIGLSGLIASLSNME